MRSALKTQREVARVIQRRANSVQSPSSAGSSAYTTRALFLAAAVAAIYAGGSLASLKDDRVHDFFVERIPMGSEGVALAERLLENDEPSSSVPKRAVPSVSPRKLVSSPADAVETKPLRADSPPKAPRSEPKPEPKPKMPVPSTTTSAAVEAVGDLVKQAEAALGLSATDTTQGAPSVSPAAKPVYSGPPLPLGFSPPLEYAPRRETDGFGEAHSPYTLPPLPRLAPEASALNASEPVLGQLASSIDQLSQFLQGASRLSARDDVRDPATILVAARGDLDRLSRRLDQLKHEATDKLQEELQKKSQDYEKRIEEQQRELLGRLEAQEEGWQQSIEAERQRLVDTYRERLSTELATQQEIINQRLKEEVIAQGVEMQRRWLHDVKLKVEEERSGRLGRLEQLREGLHHIEGLTLENSASLDDSLQAHALWSAVRAAATAAPSASSTAAALDKLHNAATQARAPAVTDVLSALEPSTVAHGSTTASSLAASFHARIAPRVRRVALLPENAGCLAYFASALLSPLLALRDGSTARGHDVASILARAQFQLDQHNVDGAVRECNQLRGWPKILLRDWLVTARAFLEIKQALEVAQGEAALRSLEAA